jgi:two-component system, chemotaxis family, response regulator PixG
LTDLKHIQFLKNLGQLRFSGQLVCSNSTKQKWIVYLSQGCIIYATGGLHPVRRWRRNLVMYCRPIPTYRLAWQTSLAKADAATLASGWEYALLKVWVAQQDITQEQANRVIRSAITEVLFDMMQAVDVTTQISPDSVIASPLNLVDVNEAIAAAQQRWQIWQTAKLAPYSPNQAPKVKQPEELRRHVSAQLFQKLTKLLNGEHSLYDLATEMQHDVIKVAASLRLYFESDWIELIHIPDLPAPIYRRNPPSPLPSAPAPQKALIACVDDSSVLRHTMEELLTSAGYEFLGVDDALRAIGILLARKPDVIFLDLMMPNINGYELCQQLRKLSCFRQTPIVILTGNDGFANRLRSNIVQASDFLSKPLNAEAVLGVIRKYLGQGTTPVSADH